MYGYLADLVMVIHFLFIVFMVVGGLIVLWRPKVAWIHIPVFIWGAIIGIFGWICPLTPLENELRRLAEGNPRSTDFVQHYLMPVIYPELLFPEGFPEQGFLWLSLSVLGLNLLVYSLIARKFRGNR